jgi:hypothetical protein
MGPSKAVRAASFPRHDRGMGTAWRRVCVKYGDDAVGRAAHGRHGLPRRARRVARAGWRGGAADALSNRPTQAAWSSWGLGVRAGPTVETTAAAAHGRALDVARWSGTPGARNFSKWPCLTEQISKKLNRSGPSSE